MIIIHIHKMIMEEDNKNLNKLVSMEEVAPALNEIHNGKAPGKDVFTIYFPKACWEIVKTDIYEEVSHSQDSTTILKYLNSMFISLITKEQRAITLEKFRPIALCNVL